MATYKKRGHKPKTKVEKQEALETNSTTAEVFNTLDQSANRTEAWLEKNQKFVLALIGGIAIVVLGYLGYQEFIQKPKEAEATQEMAQAQSFFEQALTATNKDSLYNLALQGAGGKYGFIDIADNYSGTQAGNLANYYAGISYYNLNDYQNAITYLDKFTSQDAILNPLAQGAIGDAFMQLNQLEDALKYYEKAATMHTNNYSTPRYLFKAGLVALKLNKPALAQTYFETIENDYPDSEEAKKAPLYKNTAAVRTK